MNARAQLSNVTAENQRLREEIKRLNSESDSLPLIGEIETGTLNATVCGQPIIYYNTRMLD